MYIKAPYIIKNLVPPPHKAKSTISKNTVTTDKTSCTWWSKTH